MIEKLKSKGLQCTGCGACENICIHDAISMKKDSYGFLYPFINVDLCVSCGACSDVCPVLQNDSNSKFHSTPVCYAVMADNDIRQQSSSGGAFSVFATSVLESGGFVIGASLNSDLSVSHVCIQSKSELYKLQKSKYIQSSVGLLYREIETYLKDNRPVLFSGCPCQIAGLRSFLHDDYYNLYTIDILCHGVASHQMLLDSLYPTEPVSEIVSLDFRDKSIGWNSLHLRLRYKDNTSKLLSLDESYYEQGFHYNLILRESCYNCKFCEFPRQGDISIGDFWEIDRFVKELDDGKGTSLVFVNTSKGKHWFRDIQSLFKKNVPVPLEFTEVNRVHAETNRHPGRDYFLSLYPKQPFNKSVLFALQNRFDIGLVGNWSYPNYGSELTYYALYALLVQWGYSVLMISWPKHAKWKPYETPQLFNNSPYPPYVIAPLSETRKDLRIFNQKCDMFVQGSDQLFNNNLYNWFDKFMQLDWVQDNKKKIAYAASFGTDYIWGSDDDRAELAYFLQKFDAFSVREESAKTIAKKYYNVDADIVLDPVFLHDRTFYDSLRTKGNGEINLPKEKYLFSYTLDPNESKASALRFCANSLNLSIRAASDAAIDSSTIVNSWNIETISGLSIEQWISHIACSEYVITDSFHGTCFAIIYEKPFLSICNPERGSTRFQSLLGRLGLTDRLIKSELELLDHPELLEESIDYTAIYSKLSILKDESINWLKHTLDLQNSPLKSLSSYDFLAQATSSIEEKIISANKKYSSMIEVQKDNQSQFAQSVDNSLANIQQEIKKTRDDLEKTLNDLKNTQNKLCAMQTISEDSIKEAIQNIQSSIISIEGRNDYLNNQYMILTTNLSKEIEKSDTQYLSSNNNLNILRSDLNKNIAINTERLNEFSNSIENLKLALTNAQIANLQKNSDHDILLESLGLKINQIFDSKSYFIGRIITWLPKKILNCVQKIWRR